jgi:hypothetical protein
VTRSGQLILDRAAHGGNAGERSRADGEREARQTLRAQVARLERELSAIVAARFPFIPAAVHLEQDGGEEPVRRGPSLLGLDQLERTRDTLAGRLQDLRRRALVRDEQERLAHELLEHMKLEPGRFRHVHLPVSDLGQGGCGVWHVRPRLGLIGMLAGWWQLKLSSGCPLPRGPRPSRGPDRSS